jgi:hypothetical protein
MLRAGNGAITLLFNAGGSYRPRTDTDANLGQLSLGLSPSFD